MAATSNEPVLLLKTAVTHITDYISNQGMPPQEALTKVSRELDLAPNFIKRASEATNVGLTHSHFKKNASARDAAFPITDADVAVQEIFGDAVKQASLTEEVYSTPSNFKLGLHKFASAQYKQAYEQIVNTENPEQQLSSGGVAYKSAMYLDKMEKNASEAHYNVVDAEFKVSDAFASVVNEFRKEASARQEWHDFETQAFAEHGEKCAQFIDLIYKAAELKDERGERNSNALNYSVGPQTKKFASLISALDNLGEKQKEASEAHLAFTEVQKQTKQAFQEIGKAKLASLQGSENLTLLEEIVAEKTAEDNERKEWIPASYKGKEISFKNTQKAHKLMLSAGGIDKAYASLKAHGLLKESEHDPVLKAAEEKQQKAQTTLQHVFKSMDFGKPVHAALSTQGDNAKRQQLLSELITTDPILKETDPQHIADAYLQMISLAPELSLHKEVVRGHLRQAAQGQAINPHDASLLSGANNDLLKTKEMRSPKVEHKPTTH